MYTGRFWAPQKIKGEVNLCGPSAVPEGTLWGDWDWHRPLASPGNPRWKAGALGRGPTRSLALPPRPVPEPRPRGPDKAGSWLALDCPSAGVPTGISEDG